MLELLIFTVLSVTGMGLITTTARKTIVEQQATIDKLTDKLMARSFVEYKEQTLVVPVSGPVEVSDEEEWAREIESMKSGDG